MVTILTFLIFILLIASLNALECGISNQHDGRIVGGYNTSTSKYPWMVFLCRKGRFWCGGSLIDKEWVLTAAHCIKETKKKAKPIPQNYTSFLMKELGYNDCSEGGGKEYKSAKIYVHPNFNFTTGKNDIALIKLATPVSKLGSKNSPNVICLPKSSTIDSYLKKKHCKYTGWGVSSFTADYVREYPLQLQEGVAILNKCENVSPNYTRTEMRKKGSQAILKICSENPNSTTCSGDSGGPLMCYKKNKWKLVGVLSVGGQLGVNCIKKKCIFICKKGAINNFSFVPQYIKWIKDIMKKK